jgi:hypothetical protein
MKEATMGFFRKKADPISERAKALQQEIAALESQIKKLSSQAGQENVVSTLDHISVAPEPIPIAPRQPISVAEPVFEEIEPAVKLQPEPIVVPQIYNEHGVRKFDLPAALRKLTGTVQGQAPANAKLVTFLAAGSIKGLQPLRYEKRVARNRFIFLSIFLALILWGVLTVFLRQH